MNSVSWFLYAAEVVTNLNSTILGFSIAAVIWIVISSIPACIGKFDDVMGDGSFFDKFWLPMTKWLAPVTAACFVLTALIPSKMTMYAIAASQIGETVIASAETREMIDDSKQILRDYLKSLKKEASK